MSIYDEVDPQQLAYLEQLEIPELRLELKQAQEQGNLEMIGCITEMIREEQLMDKQLLDFQDRQEQA